MVDNAGFDSRTAVVDPRDVDAVEWRASHSGHP